MAKRAKIDIVIEDLELVYVFLFSVFELHVHLYANIFFSF